MLKPGKSPNLKFLIPELMSIQSLTLPAPQIHKVPVLAGLFYYVPADPVHFGYGATYLGVASYHGARTWSLGHRAYVGVFCLGLRAGLSKLQVSSLGILSVKVVSVLRSIACPLIP